MPGKTKWRIDLKVVRGERERKNPKSKNKRGRERKRRRWQPVGGAIVSKRAVCWFTLSQFSSIESEATRVQLLLSPLQNIFLFLSSASCCVRWNFFFSNSPRAKLFGRNYVQPFQTFLCVICGYIFPPVVVWATFVCNWNFAQSIIGAGAPVSRSLGKFDAQLTFTTPFNH